MARTKKTAELDPVVYAAKAITNSLQARQKPTAITAEEHKTICDAKAILRRQLKRSQAAITGAATAADYLQLQIGAWDREVVYVLYLDQRHHVIGEEPLFFGGINECAIDVRVLLAKALGHGGVVALILAHNHPSGSLEPSQADIHITDKIRGACEIVGINLLDHLIVSPLGHTSLAALSLGGL